MSEEPPQTAVAETRKLAALMFTDMGGFSRRLSRRRKVNVGLSFLAMMKPL